MNGAFGFSRNYVGATLAKTGLRIKQLKLAPMDLRGQTRAMTIDWNCALNRARDNAPFLALAMKRRPHLVELLEQGKGEVALELARGEAIAPEASFDEVGEALRKQRLSLALVLAIGDLAGAFPLARVIGELSSFADYALDKAMRTCVARRCPDTEFAGFFAIALGKQGAGELNYSSDIDPILLFDPETLPHKDHEEPGEAAQRYSRWLIELMSKPTGEGYVQRVDLRLRPASEVSPLAIPVPAAISHYESSALAWERAAYIRARASSGDIAAGESFLEEIRPFIWRRSLDFTAIEEIRRLTARIRDAYDGPLVPSAGFDVKRGRGGIREVEFFAQTHQLIYGGRMSSLRVRGTREALDALAAEKVISQGAAQELGDAYDRLREVEHRLQMVEDRQTHELPHDNEALERVASLDGKESAEALLAELEQICGRVASYYDGLLGEDENGAPLAHVDLEKPSAAKIQASTIEVEQEIDPKFSAHFDLRAERLLETARCLRSEEAKLAFGDIRPQLLGSLALGPDPDRALARFETLLSRLPTAINLFRLFEQRPGLLETVLRVLTLASPLADELSRRPELLDALIDNSALNMTGTVEELSEQMRDCESEDYETRLDRVRQIVGEARFALGVHLIDQHFDPLDVAEGLARVAGAAVEVCGLAARLEFETKHGRLPKGELLALGLGRLGGGALSHASDLDMVYLFDGEIGLESDGARPLSTTLYFNRLASRMTGALSVPTAEGALYEVDTRLRPQGHQGPMAVSLESFALYQSGTAWTWEHMALCRARPVYGSAAGRKKIRDIVDKVLTAPRDKDKLRGDVLTMRGDVVKSKPSRGVLDVKLLRGGLMDSEFLVHYLQLREGIGLVPALEDAIAQLSEAGHLSKQHQHHHLTLTRILVAARLLAPDLKPPSAAAQKALAAACNCENYAELLQVIMQARHGVAAQWAVTFGETLEIS